MAPSLGAFARPMSRFLSKSAVFACALASGCDRIEQVIQDKVHEEVQEQVAEAEKTLPAPSTGPTTEEEKIAAKLNLYVECTNRSRDRIRESWERYSERVDAKTGVARAKQKPHIVRIEGELEPCRHAVDQGERMEPALPEIEAAMKSYYASGTELAGYTQQLDDYYENDGPKGDEWEKGKAIAPQLLAAWEAWDAADVALETAVDAKKDENDAKLLALIEAREGKNLRWHAQHVVLAAKTLARCVAVEGTKAATCDDAHGALAAAASDFRAYHDAHAAEAEAVFWMSSFQGAVGTYVTEAEALMRSLRDGKAKPDERQRATDRYNDLVNAANNLKFDMP
jgi:hypothetical protein